MTKTNENITVTITRDELKALIFAAKSDLETVLDEPDEWPTTEAETIRSAIDKLTAAGE